MITNTILGFPYHNYSIIGPRTLIIPIIRARAQLLLYLACMGRQVSLDIWGASHI